jgi:hypothetical protein
MKKILHKAIATYICFSPMAVYAAILKSDVIANIESQNSNLVSKAGFDTTSSVGSIIAIVIKAFLGMLGIIFIILMVLAGYNWMTAAGDEQKVEKAKDEIKRAIIGLIICTSAYAISYFVFKALGNTTTGGPLVGP